MTLFDPAAELGGSLAPKENSSKGNSSVDSNSVIIRMTVAYDGTDFHGFAQQRDQRTVAGEISGALSKVLRAEITLACAGRTDAGVHAWGQVVSFGAPDGTDPAMLVERLNRMLGSEIAVRDASIAPAGFDARHSARARTYRYTVLNRSTPDPSMARSAWWVPEPIDLHALQLAATPFIGEHDFASFCRKGPEGSTTVRRVLESEWSDLGGGVLRYQVKATAFCWQMVRALVGTQVEAGRGKRKAGEILSILRAKDRAAAGQLAPPHGLSLWRVDYEDASS
ncbi:MAG: tRNA pseudouridine(38-40) synthase TruA [Actinomycetes bacterium]